MILIVTSNIDSATTVIGIITVKDTVFKNGCTITNVESTA